MLIQSFDIFCIGIDFVEIMKIIIIIFFIVTIQIIFLKLKSEKILWIIIIIISIFHIIAILIEIMSIFIIPTTIIFKKEDKIRACYFETRFISKKSIIFKSIWVRSTLFSLIFLYLLHALLK